MSLSLSSDAQDRFSFIFGLGITSEYGLNLDRTYIFTTSTWMNRSNEIESTECNNDRSFLRVCVCIYINYKLFIIT